jgi:hypothetical protein
MEDGGCQLDSPLAGESKIENLKSKIPTLG